MNKLFKKLSLCILFCLSVVVLLSVTVFADTASIDCDGTVYENENFTVTVKYVANNNFYAHDFRLEYDSSVLKYVSGGDRYSEKSIKWVDADNGIKEISFEAQFCPIKEGTTNLALKCEVGALEKSSADAEKQITVKSAKANKDTVQSDKGQSAEKSSENMPYLSELTVSAGELSPVFNPKTSKYTLKLDSTVDKITVDAKATAGEVKGTGEYEIGEGETEITVTVTSGDVTGNYTIKVKKAAADKSSKDVETEQGSKPHKFNYNYLWLLLPIAAGLIILKVALSKKDKPKTVEKDKEKSEPFDETNEQ